MQVVQNDPDFVQFETPEYGFRSMARILRSYESRGINSIRDIISTHAPSSENKTESYIRFVADRLNIPENQPISVDSILFDIIQAITIFENGALFAEHYNQTTIEAGIALA